jgi:predicted alpha-1,6-mannanase (GH76 family)
VLFLSCSHDARANIVTTLSILASIDDSYKTSVVQGVVAQVFQQAPASNNGSWLNNFYDDEGWWALAWIEAYDVFQDSQYLSAAETIFEDLTTGLNATCGGQWWSKAKQNVNSINNELFIAVAASLANRVQNTNVDYKQYALDQYDWLMSAGLQDSDGLFQDGLTLSTCACEGAVWTYNQGVILGALVEMQKMTGNNSYLTQATSIADAVIDSSYLTQNGILNEGNESLNEDQTSAQFKGVFVRNLGKLQYAQSNQKYVDFLTKNADSIWNNDQASDQTLGATWQGPVNSVSAASQSSALDCLVAAGQAS